MFLQGLACQNKNMSQAKVVLTICSLLLLSSVSALGQQRPLAEDLLYPGAEQQQLLYPKGQTVYAQRVPLPVQQVLLYYLKISRQPAWRLTFPNDAEAEAWLHALQRNPSQTPVFLLNLYHPKSDVNVHLTIGAIPGTSPSEGQSIITLYSTKHPLGGRQGG